MAAPVSRTLNPCLHSLTSPPPHVISHLTFVVCPACLLVRPCPCCVQEEEEGYGDELMEDGSDEEGGQQVCESI